MGVGRSRASRLAAIRRRSVPRVADVAARAFTVAGAPAGTRALVGVGRRPGASGDVVSARLAQASRSVQVLLAGITSVILMLHGAGWVAAVIVLWQNAAFHIPRAPSSIAIGLSILVLRAASARRRSRRLVVIGALAAAAIAFVAVPLPREFEGNGLMPGGAGIASSRDRFETRFRVSDGFVNLDEWFCPDGVPGDRDPVLPRPPAPGPPRAEPDARGRGRHRASGACRSCATRPATPSRTPIGLRRRPRRRELFGRTSQPYPEYYSPKPYSKSFVHPPRRLVRPEPSRRGLRRDLRGVAHPGLRLGARATRAGPPCRKLEYVDEVMAQTRGPAAPVETRRMPLEPLSASTQDAARALRAAARPLRRRPPDVLRPRPAAALLARAPSTRGHPRASFLSRMRRRRAPPGAPLDRRVPVHSSTRCSRT